MRKSRLNLLLIFVITLLVCNQIALPADLDEAVMKWSQPPVPWDASVDPNRFCGWDQISYGWQPVEGCDDFVGLAYGPPDGVVDAWDYLWLGQLNPEIDILNEVFLWGQRVADDFHCLGSMPITSIHWWGSHYGWDNPQGMPPASSLPRQWHITFWTNVSAQNNPLGFSYPEIVVHDFNVPVSRVEVSQAGIDDFLGIHPDDVCYEYYLALDPCEIFWQNDFRELTQDDTFWISIAAIYPNVVTEPAYPWGWKTRPAHWNDDAVTFTTLNNPVATLPMDPAEFTPLEFEGQSYDVAFELDTDPNYIKWTQDFSQQDVNQSIGYVDVPSYAVYDAASGTTTYDALVADDWLCQRRTPVIAIAWWGSYANYLYQANPTTPPVLPRKPDAFEIGIWTDIPDPDPTDPAVYSQPGTMVWSYKAYPGVPMDLSGFDEVLVGWDNGPYPGGGTPESVFRYSVRLPSDKWFKQPNLNGIYWLSIAAVYNDNLPDENKWGWTSHPHVFNDNAVSVGYVWDPDEHWHWAELNYQNGGDMDMCFVLFTDPAECSGCANYNSDSTVNFLDWADFADDWQWTGPASCYNNSDLNCDGVANFKDVRIFALQWLGSCP